MAYRSARTGRYVSRGAAARRPSTTVRTSGSSAGGTRYRSAKTGRFVTKATVACHPSTTVTEHGS